MSEYGIRIFNYQAASIYEYNLGIRDYMDKKPAMLTNSLFSEFMRDNGLQVSNAGTTKDVVCLEFGYGSRTYERKLNSERKILRELRKRKKESGSSLLDEEIAGHEKKASLLADKMKEIDISRQDLRVAYYQDGVDIRHVRKYNGGHTGHETIHYRMLYRTPGKAKKGTVMFIRDSLYEEAVGFLRIGISLPDIDTPIVEMGAYSSLSTSTIVGKIKIEPENILVLKDVDSFFKTKVVSIDTDEDRHCYTRDIEGYQVKNTLFDGQALIDSSIFPPWADGYILLRHHFCKMAAFNANIQTFFRDHFGDGYDSAEVVDMWGQKHLARDIKLITTDNALKFVKFDIPYNYWSGKVWENGAQFGIVKTSHSSKLGNMQQMSYQMVNALDIETIDDVIRPTTEYIEKLKNDEDELLSYLSKNVSFSNDYDVLVALVKQDHDFIQSRYFKERKNHIIESYIKHVRFGKLIQEAENLTIIGSPYAMLLHAVGEDTDKDDTFTQEDGSMQCYTERFADGEYLSGFRSPFNSRNNLNYLHNVYHQKLKRYFNLGRQIIAVNLNHTDFQDRNNGLTNWPGSVEILFKNHSVKIGKLNIFKR